MGSPYFARWAPYGLSVALFRPLGSIRALAPAMCSLRCAHTPTQPPYFAIAPYGLSVALFRPLGSIRALVIPGLRYAYPGLYSGAPSGRSLPPHQINNARTAGVHSPSPNQQRPHRGRALPPHQINNARTAGVHSPSQNQQRPHRGRPFPLTKSTMPAPRARSSPSPNQQRPRRGRPFPLAKSTTPAPRASIPPRKINNARAAGVHSPSQNQQHPHRGRPFPLAIYGEGVADRPGVRSESSTLALSQPSRSRNRGLFSCRS